MHNKISIAGKKGKTVCYTIQDLEIIEDTSVNIKWHPWRFYTPAGNLVEEGTGFRYFEIQALDEEIARESIDKEFKIVVKTGEIYVIEKYLGTQEADTIIIEGIEGDIVLEGNIPADAGENITIVYKEVSDGS